MWCLEVKDVVKHEFLPKEPEKIEFELKEDESDSTTEEGSKKEEPQTPTVRRSVRERRKPERYIPYAFCSNFSLTITDDVLRLQQDEELSGKESPSLSGPARYFWRKVYF